MNRTLISLVVGVCMAGMMAGNGGIAVAQRNDRVFELRTYTLPEGKLQSLTNRFRDHTLKLFAKHGMSVVGFWIPTDAPLSGNTLVYMLAFPSRAAADKSWREFGEDPTWKALVAETEKDGRLWSKIDRVWLSPVDFSPMK